MWVTKLLISPVKKRDLLPKNDQIWPKIVIFARPCRLIWCPVGGSVGGYGARAVSRKTPIYFMYTSMLIMLAMTVMLMIKDTLPRGSITSTRTSSLSRVPHGRL